MIVLTLAPLSTGRLATSACSAAAAASGLCGAASAAASALHCARASITHELVLSSLMSDTRAAMPVLDCDYKTFLYMLFQLTRGNYYNVNKLQQAY